MEILRLLKEPLEAQKNLTVKEWKKYIVHQLIFNIWELFLYFKIMSFKF